MRYYPHLIFTLIILFGCKKYNEKPEVDLNIISTITPKTAIQGNDIQVKVTSTGPNTCYMFTRFEIKETSPRLFEIKAKGNVANSTICEFVVYVADTSFKINAFTKGLYLFNFYNKNMLFKADTVYVN